MMNKLISLKKLKEKVDRMSTEDKIYMFSLILTQEDIDKDLSHGRDDED